MEKNGTIATFLPISFTASDCTLAIMPHDDITGISVNKDIFLKRRNSIHAAVQCCHLELISIQVKC